MKWIGYSLTVLVFVAAAVVPQVSAADLPFEVTGALVSEDIEETDRFTRQVPTTFHFLKIAPTARVAGMGGAYTPVADGMDAIFYNPAGIASVERLGWTFGYTDWFLDMKLTSAAVAINTNYGVIGISVLSLEIPGVVQRTTLKPEGTGKMLDLGDMAVGFHYAYQMTDKMSAGVQMRYAKTKLGLDQEMTGWLLSAGTLMNTGFESLRIGMGIKNLGGNTTAIGTYESRMPSTFNVGASGEIMGDLGDPVSLTVSFEGSYHMDSNQRYHVGAELWMKEMFAIRAGNNFNYDAQKWAVGAGLRGNFSGRHIAVDVSYSELTSELDHQPIRFTVSGEF